MNVNAEYGLHRAAEGADPSRAMRVLVENVSPSVDGGRHPAKRVVGDTVVVEADLVADSHDVLGGRVIFRPPNEQAWQSATLVPRANDRYGARFEVGGCGLWVFAVQGWVDEMASWQHVLTRKLEGVERADVISHLRFGANLLESIAGRAAGADRAALLDLAATLEAAEGDPEGAIKTGLSPSLLERARAYPDLEAAGRSPQLYELVVEPKRAGFSAWYEFFPRSCGQPQAHGTFRDCEERLRYAADMGFDVVYLPPIHPIGQTFRKGRNNAVSAQASDVGSPWAVGGQAGGHKAIHPQLGTLQDFQWFVERARSLGLEVALDVALQVSPDHPYVAEHPEWFIHRPDGTIQYAENPPKKYQDIYPFNFQCEQADALWRELTSIFEFWIEQGVRIFRVDNPHTKSLPFWAQCIAELRSRHPEVILLAEAFTRPKLMYALAKLGFSQSYTYFTWRNTKAEFIAYLEEITQTEVGEFFRPNFWPNTPDILPEHLQFGGRATYAARLVLAATLSSNYGIYGPAFELMDSEARPGSGEYLDNEKYELKSWDVARADSLKPVITQVNAIRRDNPALQQTRAITFHRTDNEQLLCYSKRAFDNVVLIVVSLDPHFRQGGFVDLDLEALGVVDDGDAYQVHDVLGGTRYLWSGRRNYVELDPAAMPAHIFVLRRRLRSEHDFDYFA